MKYLRFIIASLPLSECRIPFSNDGLQNKALLRCGLTFNTETNLNSKVCRVSSATSKKWDLSLRTNLHTCECCIYSFVSRLISYYESPHHRHWVGPVCMIVSFPLWHLAPFSRLWSKIWTQSWLVFRKKTSAEVLVLASRLTFKVELH